MTTGASGAIGGHDQQSFRRSLDGPGNHHPHNQIEIPDGKTLETAGYVPLHERIAAERMNEAKLRDFTPIIK
jgi:hypothetical protein